MTRKKDAYMIDEDLSDVIFGKDSSNASNSNGISKDRRGISVLEALEIVIKQMEQEGKRPRTIKDYDTHVRHYVKTLGIDDISEVSSDSVYEWLSSMKVADSTKLIRLKCLRAFFERCNIRGWLPDPWWRNIKIKVSSPVKKSADERDILFVLSMLDLSDFIQLRDAVAILTLYQTGIRIETAALLREKHVDINGRALRLGGDIMKNHNALILPIDERLARLLSVLIEQNKKVRREKRTNNDYVFITAQGEPSLKTPTNNNIARRINAYRKEYKLDNFSAHAIRRAYAYNLYKRSGRDLALVSKALGHSDFSVTSRYLDLGAEEVADDLRKYL